MDFFPKNFIWGTATSSYQIEGAGNEGGKGESIWDKFAHSTKKINNNDTGDIACNHYHLYKEDIAHMKEMGVNAYRFSISWPRIFPHGRGLINQEGIDFYNNLIDHLVANEIQPFITLHHWDLPLELSKSGGWSSRETVDAFVNYAETCFEAYGDRVKYWITFNEPLVFTVLFSRWGVYQKHNGKTFNLRRAVQASHLVNCAHARTVQKFKDIKIKGGKVGITHVAMPAYGKGFFNKKIAKIAYDISVRWWIEPSLKGCYPLKLFKWFKFLFRAPMVEDGELSLIEENIGDFIGINYYRPLRIGKNKELTMKYNDVGWEVYPRGLLDLLKDIDEIYEKPEIFITENGFPSSNEPESVEMRIEDDERCDYIKNHLLALNQAIKTGINIKGYFLWSLMDNFEWLHGYSTRFGLIHVNFANQQRTWKKSANLYKNIISNDRTKELIEN
mgnify:CR=1 FL=1